MIELERQIAEVVRAQLGCRHARPEDRLQEDLGADSADLLNLIVALEDRFGIAISEEDAATLGTVADLSRLVSEREARS